MRNKNFIKILTVYRNAVKFPRNLPMNIQYNSTMYPLKGCLNFFPDSQNYNACCIFVVSTPKYIKRDFSINFTGISQTSSKAEDRSTLSPEKNAL